MNLPIRSSGTQAFTAASSWVEGANQLQKFVRHNTTVQLQNFKTGASRFNETKTTNPDISTPHYSTARLSRRSRIWSFTYG
jgi:hypothetical protein